MWDKNKKPILNCFFDNDLHSVSWTENPLGLMASWVAKCQLTSWRSETHMGFYYTIMHGFGTDLVRNPVIWLVEAGTRSTNLHIVLETVTIGDRMACRTYNHHYRLSTGKPILLQPGQFTVFPVVSTLESHTLVVLSVCDISLIAAQTGIMFHSYIKAGTPKRESTSPMYMSNISGNY